MRKSVIIPHLKATVFTMPTLEDFFCKLPTNHWYKTDPFQPIGVFCQSLDYVNCLTVEHVTSLVIDNATGEILRSAEVAQLFTNDGNYLEIIHYPNGDLTINLSLYGEFYSDTFVALPL